MKKVTAVEWLMEQLGVNEIVGTDYSGLIRIFAEAKEMEKQNLYNFYIQGGIDCATQADRTVENFYNETFKSE